MSRLTYTFSKMKWTAGRGGGEEVGGGGGGRDRVVQVAKYGNSFAYSL